MTVNKIITSGCLVTLILLSAQTRAYAAVYKWTDSEGQIHYSDQPQADGAEKVTIRENTTTKPRQVTVDTAGDDADTTDPTATDEDQQSAEEDAEYKPRMVEVEPSRKQKNRLCNEAKQDIAAINSRGRMREVNSKGEYVYLSEQERQQRLSAAKKKKREFCR